MLEQPTWRKNTCNLCGNTYSQPDGCDCVDLLIDHARSCAVEACVNGYWSAYDNSIDAMYSDPYEIAKGDSPRIEDAQDLVRRYGRQSKTAMNFWKNEWRIAVVSWLLQLNDYKKICGICRKSFATIDRNFITHGICTSCYNEEPF